MIDNHGYSGAVLMDLSKAFDTINHELLLAKLNSYGFDIQTLRLLHSYLTGRWQRIKINQSVSSWTELLHGVPQGSVLGPLLFNIYINDLFFIIEQTDICNYADDNTLNACDMSLYELVRRLERDSLLAIEWFQNNYMKLNEDKCHLLISGFKHEIIWANIGTNKVWESNEEKLLGLNIDRQLTFTSYISKICTKAGQKLAAVSRIPKFMSLEKRRILIKAFFDSQFEYCSLCWMFHSRTLNNRINDLHFEYCSLCWMFHSRTLNNRINDSQFEYCSLCWMFHSRTLNNRINDLHFEYCYLCWMFHSRTLNNRINDLHFEYCSLCWMFHSRTLNNRINDLHFEYCSLCWMFHSRTLNNRINDLHFRALRLIYKDDSFSTNCSKIHHRNVQKLGIELYNAKNGLSPIMMHDIFPDRNYNGPDIRSQKEFE